MSSTSNGVSIIRRYSAILKVPQYPQLLRVLAKLPVFAKYLLWVVLLLNFKSLPFGWHFRVFRPVFAIRLRHLLLRIRVFFMTRRAGQRATTRWLDSMGPVGCNPLEVSVSYKSRATLDECDFNMHLSNSSYAKALDPARFVAAVRWFPHFFRMGGWTPLAGTHFHFIREIPMFALYEVRVSIAAWDEKWLFIVCRFVTKSKKSISQPKGTTSNGKIPIAISPGTAGDSDKSLKLLKPSSLRTTTLSPLSSTNASRNQSNESVSALSVAANLANAEEPDGATLHATTISQVCFKHGRITVPPAIVMAMNGFIGLDSSLKRSSSEENVSPSPGDHLPPQWDAVRSICYQHFGGSMKKAREFLRGGWREVPKSERWWDLALDGTVEEHRKANLITIESVKKGMQVLHSVDTSRTMD